MNKTKTAALLEGLESSTTDKDSTTDKTFKQPLKAKKENKKQSKLEGVTLKKSIRLSYDLDEIEEFIDFVFHSLNDNENVLTWITKSANMGFPVSLSKALERLERLNAGRSVYFGTSTVHLEKDTNKLLNRKELFEGLHVVVLDDIGTKVSLNKIPKDLVPNYIIETSEGNFQYGYVLQEPIRSLEHAEALIQLIYNSKLSDEGGKLPNKIVRLPCGINGKKGDKSNFKVRLVELNEGYWTPDELLDVIDVGVKWKDVEEDVEKAKTSLSASLAGTSLWSPLKLTSPSLNGVVDPLLEWLYDEGMVHNDNGDWVTIECPWQHEHTSGGTTAGYSPVGRGGTGSKFRGFKCFHDHCSTKTIHDFLEHVNALGAPPVPVTDHVADLVADYAYCSADDSVYRIRGVERPTNMKIAAFRNTYPRKTLVYGEDSKHKQSK